MNMAARKSTKAPSFEESLSRLESIADMMEQSELPLDELLRLYEEGVQLAGELTKKLDEAEGRMMEVRQGRDGAPAVVATDLAVQENLLDALGENGGTV